MVAKNVGPLCSPTADATPALPCPLLTLLPCPSCYPSHAVYNCPQNLVQYEGGEPCSICGHVMLPIGTAHHESCMPATIISGFLYLGSYDTASRQDLLKSLGITHILNVSK